MTTRVRQSADTVDIAVETIITQTNPYTPLRIRAKSPKRRPSLANIRRNFSSLFGRSPSPVVDPSANKCHHCHIVGHWSNDCPLWCTICALRKGKEPRGHEAKNCRPTCTNCNGIGSVKRTIGDERTSETLELLVALASIKTVVHNFRDEHAGIQGTRDSDRRNVRIRKDIRTNIAHLAMYATKLQQDVEKLFPPPAEDRVEREIKPLDHFR